MLPEKTAQTNDIIEKNAEVDEEWTNWDEVENDTTFFDEETEEENTSDKEQSTEEETVEDNEELEDFTDTADEETKSEEIKDKQEEQEERKPKGEKSSEWAAKRRQAEMQKEIEKKAYEKGLVDAVNGINPYTNEKIEDSHDIQEFLIMREMENKGLDPITDYHKYQKTMARELTNKKNTDDEFFKNDYEQFVKDYPDVDLSKLQDDKDFVDFAEPFIKKVPLSTIYKTFIQNKAKIEKRIEQETSKRLARKAASPGSLSGPSSNDTITEEDIDKYFEAALRGKLD